MIAVMLMSVALILRLCVLADTPVQYPYMWPARLSAAIT